MTEPSYSDLCLTINQLREENRSLKGQLNRAIPMLSDRERLILEIPKDSSGADYFMPDIGTDVGKPGGEGDGSENHFTDDDPMNPDNLDKDSFDL